MLQSITKSRQRQTLRSFQNMMKMGTEKQLHKYTNDFLAIRRALDKLDTALQTNHDAFFMFYNEWLDRHEPNHTTSRVKSSQLDLFIN